MNDTYKKLLLGGLSVAIVAGSYFLIMKPTADKTNSIKNETSVLQAQLADLQSKEVNRQQYLDDTEANKELFQDRLDEFPSNLNQEYQIEFVENIRKNDDINYDVETQGMEIPEAFYVLGGSNAEGQLTSDDSSSVEAVDQDLYRCYTSNMTFRYRGSYDGVKKFVDYVAAYPYRMTIDDVSVTMDEETQEFTGSMTVAIYCITGKDREENMDIDFLKDIDTGVDNLFTGSGDAGNVSKYASDNGAAIVNDYDMIMLLNPTGSDTSGKALGMKTGGTNVTSSKNETEAVKISVSQADGKYVAEYSIGTQKQTQEFDPGEDLTILIQSSERQDDADKNGVNLTLENTSDKPLYVKIADDTTAQRVKVVNRTGSISVYK